jgi:probable rRNA maturation factor
MITTRRKPRFDLTITARVGRAQAPFLKKQVGRVHGLLKSPLRELSVALVGDSAMSALHERFMNDASPTDVLTFGLEVDSRGRVISGEIVINVSQALRESRRRGILLQNELLLYALHGMLHLKGMDDRTDSQYRRMHRLEDRILTKLGVGVVFDLKREDVNT